MMRKGDDLLNKIHSWTDMAKNGVELGLVQGANEIAEAQKRGIQVRTYPTIDLQVKDLLANRINVILIGDLGAPGIIDQTNGQVAMADPFDYEGIQSSAAFYFHPDDRDLRDLFNTAITDMKNSGKVKEILTKYNIPLNIPPPGPANG
jgi:ABC-type amino acid transport substrate-binding protein